MTKKEYTMNTLKQIGIPGLIFLTSCGAAPIDQRVQVIEPPFVVYVNNFIQDAALEKVPVVTTTLIVKFVDSMKETPTQYTLGTCTEVDQLIEINRKYWDRLSNLCQEQLIYHELGHCVLKRDHNDKVMLVEGKSVPASIMVSLNLPCDFESDKHELSVGRRSQYVHELFHRE